MTNRAGINWKLYCVVILHKADIYCLLHISELICLFEHQLPPAWPEQGCLEFRSVVLAYRDGLPNALDGLSLAVRPGEKVGIVGRTGSGKSTLFLALFRMVELNQGQILLDGLDISTVDLAQLRYAWSGGGFGWTIVIALKSPIWMYNLQKLEKLF